MDPNYNHHVNSFPAKTHHSELSVPTTSAKHMQTAATLTYQRITGQADLRNNIAVPSSYTTHLQSADEITNFETVHNFTGEPWDMSQRHQLMKESAVPANTRTENLSPPSLLSGHLQAEPVMFVNEIATRTEPLSNAAIVQSMSNHGTLNENVILAHSDNLDVVELKTATLTQPCQTITVNTTVIPNSDSDIQLTVLSPNHFPILQNDQQPNCNQVPDIRQAVSQLFASVGSPTVTQTIAPNISDKVQSLNLDDLPQNWESDTKQTDPELIETQNIPSQPDHFVERKTISTQFEHKIGNMENNEVANKPNEDSECDNVESRRNSSFKKVTTKSEGMSETPRKKNKQRNNRAIVLKMKRVVCNLCKQEHILCDCPLLSPKFYIFNSNSCSNSSLMSLTTLPQHLFLCYTNDEHGIGIFASEDIPKGTQFGPVEGKTVTFEEVSKGENLKYIWFVDKDEDADDLEYMRTEDELSSNWCRYLRSSVVLKNCNMICFTKDQKIYFISRRKIKQGKELVYYFIFLEELSHRYGWNFEIISNEDEKTCHRCRIKYNDILNYAKHIMISHPQGLKMLKSKCKICNKILFSHKELTNHAISEHGGQGAFVCDRCEKHFVSQHRLVHHNLLVHHAAGIFTCDQCGKSYGSTWKLKDHVRNKHSGMVHTCIVCHKTFSSKPIFIRHKKIHNKNYRFSCDRCGKQCRDGNNLKVHMLTHSGVKPFQCREYYCNAAFTTKQCLQIHYQKAHGYVKDNMPVISREVPFTVEAYTRSKDGEESLEYPQTTVVQ